MPSPTALPSMSWMLLSCLMLLSQVQGEVSNEDLSSPRISCPQGSYAFGFHCYALFKIPKSWNRANLACQNRPSGSLVSVLNEAEASFLASLIKKHFNTCSNIWIGLQDTTEMGDWQWSNNDVMNYEAWETRPVTTDTKGYCGSLTHSSGYLQWKENECFEKLPFVCKFRG